MKKRLSILIVFLLLIGCMSVLSACAEREDDRDNEREEEEENDEESRPNGSDDETGGLLIEPEKVASQNLLFALSSDGTSYSVIALGECTDQNVVIPMLHEGLPVTAIAADAFAACTSVRSLVVPSTVTAIGDYAFRDCTYLESIVIPNAVQSIGKGLFARCVSLTSVTLPAGLTAIPDFTFYGCSSLASFPIAETITEIGAGAFRDCTALKSAIIPATVQKIGTQAYYNCLSLTYFEMNAKLKFVTKVNENGDLVVDTEQSTIGEYMLYRFSPDMDPETGIVFDRDPETGNVGMQAYYEYYCLDIEPPSLE